MRAVDRMLDTIGIAHLADTAVATLSGGEAQRVALARALVLQPDVLLLDEPTANLDVTAQRRFREDLERIVRAHARAAVVVTHDAAEAFALADRVAVLEAGRLTQVGAPEELVAEPATPFVAAFTGAELLLDGTVGAVDDDGLIDVRLDGGGALRAILAPGRPPLRAGARVHVAYRPEDVTLGPPGPAAATSAVNRLGVAVRSLVPAGALVRVRLDGTAPLTALLTRESAQALGLAPGARLTAYLKAAALRAFPA
jgi:molybdopterin-binding protein